MVQIIDHRPDFIPAADIVFLSVSESPTEPGTAVAEWRCLAHAGAIVGSSVGMKGDRKDAQSAFAEAVSYAHEHQIEFMVIDDPAGLFPPERRFRPAADSPDLVSPVDTRADGAREQRLRRLAARQGLYLGKARTRDRQTSGNSRYIVFSDPSRAVAVFGGSPAGRNPSDVGGAGYQATLDEIEAYLVRGEGLAEPTPPETGPGKA